LALIRLLQGFRGKSLPLGFVADQLRLDDAVLRHHIQALADQHIVKTDGESVSMA
jgi:hypothetical protein